MRRILTWSLGIVVALLVAIQLAPYGRRHVNPPVRKEPAWNAEQTRVLAARACFDCHSNETYWPWYSNVAPISWLVQYDVEEGRRAVNYSEWDRPQKEPAESAKTVREREMPPWFYLLTRPHARLTDAERQALIAGLEATFGAGKAGSPGRRERGREKE